MTAVAASWTPQLDLNVLRLAREIRAEVAESLATKGLAARDGDRVDAPASMDTVRRLAARALDQRVADILAVPVATCQHPARSVP